MINKIRLFNKLMTVIDDQINNVQEDKQLTFSELREIIDDVAKTMTGNVSKHSDEELRDFIKSGRDAIKDITQSVNVYTAALARRRFRALSDEVLGTNVAEKVEDAIDFLEKLISNYARHFSTTVPE